MIFAAIDPVVGIVFSAIVAAIGTYLVSARTLSGKIKNSDAEELWAESRSIREWSTSRVKELNEHVEQLEQRLAAIELANSELAKENRAQSRTIYDLRNEIHGLQTQIISLTKELEDERTLVSRLRWEAEHAPRRRHSDPPITDEHETEGGTSE